MKDMSELFWQASLEEIKQGFVFDSNTGEYICLLCGKAFTDGLIYSEDNQLYEARKFIEVHTRQQHGSTFNYLLNLDKKLTGLTDHQKTILELFYDGHSDNEVAKALDTGSTSTIRNHRFSLREKQKQAKIFLAIMELLGARISKKNAFINIPRNSKNIDDRFAITEQENEKILAAAFPQELQGQLATYPLKEKKRVAILRHIVKNFDSAKTYTEKEVNAILKEFYEDYVLLRRQLIEYGFMDRTQDGSSYWIKL